MCYFLDLGASVELNALIAFPQLAEHYIERFLIEDEIKVKTTGPVPCNPNRFVQQNEANAANTLKKASQEKHSKRSSGNPIHSGRTARSEKKEKKSDKKRRVVKLEFEGFIVNDRT